VFEQEDASVGRKTKIHRAYLWGFPIDPLPERTDYPNDVIGSKKIAFMLR
jgi:hypothetical protein